MAAKWYEKYLPSGRERTSQATMILTALNVFFFNSGYYNYGMGKLLKDVHWTNDPIKNYWLIISPSIRVYFLPEVLLALAVSAAVLAVTLFIRTDRPRLLIQVALLPFFLIFLIKLSLPVISMFH